jgi:hypothetical protein
VLSVSAIVPAWAVRSATAEDPNVFKRPAQDPQKDSQAQSGASGASKAKSDTESTAEAQGDAKGAGKLGQSKLKPAEARQVAELAERDREVRAHEAAHQAAAGGLGGAASFTYETGPDGKVYVVGGEVSVDMSGGRSPEETIARAAQIRAAALAPADPSPQDLAVAADASAMEAAARQQISRRQMAVRAAAVSGKASSARHVRQDVQIPVVGQKSAAGTGESQAVDSSSTSSASQTNPVEDVSAKAAAAAVAIAAERSITGPSTAQLQQLAHLATVAYRR